MQINHSPDKIGIGLMDRNTRLGKRTVEMTSDVRATIDDRWRGLPEIVEDAQGTNELSTRLSRLAPRHAPLFEDLLPILDVSDSAFPDIATRLGYQAAVMPDMLVNLEPMGGRLLYVRDYGIEVAYRRQKSERDDNEKTTFIYGGENGVRRGGTVWGFGDISGQATHTHRRRSTFNLATIQTKTGSEADWSLGVESLGLTNGIAVETLGYQRTGAIVEQQVWRGTDFDDTHDSINLRIGSRGGLAKFGDSGLMVALPGSGASVTRSHRIQESGYTRGARTTVTATNQVEISEHGSEVGNDSKPWYVRMTGALIVKVADIVRPNRYVARLLGVEVAEHIESARTREEHFSASYDTQPGISLIRDTTPVGDIMAAGGAHVYVESSRKQHTRRSEINGRVHFKSRRTLGEIIEQIFIGSESPQGRGQTPHIRANGSGYGRYDCIYERGVDANGDPYAYSQKNIQVVNNNRPGSVRDYSVHNLQAAPGEKKKMMVDSRGPYIYQYQRRGNPLSALANAITAPFRPKKTSFYFRDGVTYEVPGNAKKNEDIIRHYY